MAELELNDFDLVVVGTSLVESIVAAAAARVGKAVLHLDERTYYGGRHSTFDYDQFVKWIADTFGDASDQAAAASLPPHIHSQRRQFNIDLIPELVFNTGPLVQSLMTSGVGKYLEFRTIQKFLVYSHGKLHTVPCTRSDVFANKELSLLDKRYMMKFFNSCMQKEEPEVPLSEYEQRSFAEYLTACKLSPRVQEFILYCIALLRDDQLTAPLVASADEDAAPFVLPQPQPVPAAADLVPAAAAGAADSGAAAAAAGGADEPATPAQSPAAQPENSQQQPQQTPGSYVGELTRALPHRGAAALSAAGGVRAVRAFVVCLGRYGDTAAMTPIYGGSELAQAFCRLCAVFGGVYMLRCGVRAYRTATATDAQTLQADAARARAALSGGSTQTDDAATEQTTEAAATPEDAAAAEGATAEEKPVRARRLVAETDGGQLLGCDHLLLSPDAAGAAVSPDLSRVMLRCVALLDKPLDMAQLCFVVVPPGALGNASTVFAMQADESTSCTPAGCYLVHLYMETQSATAPDVAAASAALQPVLTQLATDAGATVYAQHYFALVPRYPSPASVSTLPAGAYVTSDLLGIDNLDRAVAEARAIFERVFPGEVFLPTPPPADDGTAYTPRDLTHEFLASSALDAIGKQQPSEDVVEEPQPQPQPQEQQHEQQPQAQVEPPQEQQQQEQQQEHPQQEQQEPATVAEAEVQQPATPPRDTQ